MAQLRRPPCSPCSPMAGGPSAAVLHRLLPGVSCSSLRVGMASGRRRAVASVTKSARYNNLAAFMLLQICCQAQAGGCRTDAAL